MGTVSSETRWRKYAKYIYVCQVQVLMNMQSCDEQTILGVCQYDTKTMKFLSLIEANVATVWLFTAISWDESRATAQILDATTLEQFTASLRALTGRNSVAYFLPGRSLAV